MDARPALALSFVIAALLLVSSNGLAAFVGAPSTHGATPGTFFQGTVVIYPNGALSQPTAPISVAGNTYTLTDRFNGSIVDERNNSILDGAGHVLNDTPVGGRAIYLSSVNDVTIENFHVINATDSVFATNVDALTVSGNRFNGTQYGVLVSSSQAVSLLGNNFSAFGGAYVTSTTGLRIAGNDLSTPGLNAVLGTGDSNVNVSSNKVNAVSYGLYFSYGSNISYFANTGAAGLSSGVDAMAIYYVQGPIRVVDNKFIGAGTGVDLEYSTNILVQGNNLSGAGTEGAYLSYDVNSQLIGDNLSFARNEGLYLDYDHNVRVDHVQAGHSASGYGVYSEYNDGQWFSNVSAPWCLYGLYVSDSRNTWVTTGNFSHAGDSATYFEYSVNSTILNSDLSYGNYYNLYSNYDQNVHLAGDILTHEVSSGDYGAYLEYDTNDTIVASNLSSDSNSVYAYAVNYLVLNHDNLSFSQYGAYLDQCTNVVVLHTNASWASSYGIYDYYDSNTWIEFVNSSWSDYGLYTDFDQGTLTVLHVNTLHDTYGAYVEANTAHVSYVNASYDSVGYYSYYNVVSTLSHSSFFSDGYGWEDYQSTAVQAWNNVYWNDTYGAYLEDEISLTSTNELFVNNTYAVYAYDIYGPSIFQRDHFVANTYPFEGYYNTQLEVLSNNFSGLASGQQVPDVIYVYQDYGSTTILDNQMVGIAAWGIELYDSANILVAGNDLRGSGTALEVGNVNLGRFIGNDLSYSGHGLSFNNTTATLVEANAFVADRWAFHLNDSNQNVFYHNDFVRDGGYGFEGVYTPNTFNASMPVGGNFWSNYTGTDGNGDGIGDTPQSVGGKLIVDYLPLMTAWSPYTVTFVASGLPTGTSWSVTLGGVTQTTTGTAAVYAQTNGAITPFTWTVTPLAGYVGTPMSGSGTWNSTDQVITIAFVPFTYQVKFVEAGLPAGTAWSITSGTQTVSSTKGALNLSLTNGTSAWTLAPVAGYVATPSSGTVTVAAAPTTVSIAFVAFLYPVTFSETGLPAGTSWGISVNGGPAVATTLLNQTFLEPNGTATYVVPLVPGYVATPASGSVAVSGAAMKVAITFALKPTPTYSVAFSESGLAKGTAWSVLVGGLKLTGNTSGLSTHLANGTYTFAVGALTGFAVTPASGTVTVNGAATSQAVQFISTAVPTFGVSFTETGLPSGSDWTLDVAGSSNAVASTSYSTSLTNGSYSYAVTAPSGYVASPAGGHFTVSGSSVTVSIVFSKAPSTAATQGLSGTTEYGLLGALIALAIVAVLGWLLFVRSKRSGPANAGKGAAPASTEAVAAPPPAASTEETKEPASSTTEPNAATTEAGSTSASANPPPPPPPPAGEGADSEENSWSEGGEPPAPPTPAPGN